MIDHKTCRHALKELNALDRSDAVKAVTCYLQSKFPNERYLLDTIQSYMLYSDGVGGEGSDVYAQEIADQAVSLVQECENHEHERASGNNYDDAYDSRKSG